MKDSLNIAIAGATGYVGLELIKILSKHPKANILFLCAQKSIGKSINSFDKSIKKKFPKVTKISKIKWNLINVLFTALPNGEAQKISLNIPKHVKLIDLSADFRLDSISEYKKWYKIKHLSEKLNQNSVYSVSEFVKNKLLTAKIISCPGCYPTSVQLPLIPLIKNNMIKLNNIIIDSKSGFSGGGKNIKKKFKFKNLFNSVSVYGIGSHRHMAEIDQELSKAANRKVNVHFTPHLIPMFRGILSTIYLETSDNMNAKKIYNFLKKYHKNNYFVKIAKFNTSISTSEVINSNFCKISVCIDRFKKRIIIVSAIDNLVKGASGQAVQNMNISYKLKENTGLI